MTMTRNQRIGIYQRLIAPIEAAWLAGKLLPHERANRLIEARNKAGVTGMPTETVSNVGNTELARITEAEYVERRRASERRRRARKLVAAGAAQMEA